MADLIPCDLHIHPDYSIDARSSIEQYCDRAGQIGLPILGFSTHYDINPARDDIDPFMNVDGEKVRADHYALGRYIDDCLKARNMYSDLKILIGLEVDYFIGVEAEVMRLKSEFQFDYMIGSVHCLNGVAISDKNEAGNFFNSHSLDKMADMYFELLYNVANCGLFDIIGHADYYLRHGLYYYGEDIFNIYKNRLEKTVEAAVRTGTGFEINTSYLRHGGDDFFPRLDFLKAAIKHGAIINSIGSDAHHTDHLGAYINKALDLITEHDLPFKPIYETG
jgi:histidinol-phosphatase (PHP family)